MNAPEVGASTLSGILAFQCYLPTVCGIFGVVCPTGLDARHRQQFERLSDALEHRGPDGSGFVREPNLLMGMHRLSIMDLVNGDQPFTDEQGNYWAIENGEIYNASELRNELMALGHRFSSGSDAEVIPHAIEEWGLEGFTRLRGMYAIAVLDRQRGLLHLIRDRMGEKPLYTYRTPDSVWFASELRALVKSGCVTPGLEEASVADYLVHGFVPEGTIICGTEKVTPGTIMTISLSDGSTSTTHYWEPWQHLGVGTPDTKELAARIEEAVAVACSSDVPVGVALSGGLDSGLVAAIAARHVPALRAFTVGYDTASSSDETAAASNRAIALNIQHTKIMVSSSDVGKSYGAVTSARDEPIADIAGPSYLALAHAFRDEGVPVLLSGQGGDELFWGYPWVQSAALMCLTDRPPIVTNPPEYLSSLLRSKGALLEGVRSLGGTGTYQRMKALRHPESQEFTAVPLFPLSPRFAKIRRNTRRLMRGHRIADPILSYPISTPDTGLFIVGIMQTYLRTNGLAQLDRLTMHKSVEARTPLVDYKLVEYVLGHQGREGAALRKGKEILRQSAQILAPQLADIGRKQGFTPPIRAWMSAIWSHERKSLDDLALTATGLFREQQLRRRISRPITRLGEVDALAFRLLTLELWWRDLSA